MNSSATLSAHPYLINGLRLEEPNLPPMPTFRRDGATTISADAREEYASLFDSSELPQDENALCADAVTQALAPRSETEDEKIARRLKKFRNAVQSGRFHNWKGGIH